MFYSATGFSSSLCHGALWSIHYSIFPDLKEPTLLVPRTGVTRVVVHGLWFVSPATYRFLCVSYFQSPSEVLLGVSVEPDPSSLFRRVGFREEATESTLHPFRDPVTNTIRSVSGVTLSEEPLSGFCLRTSLSETHPSFTGMSQRNLGLMRGLLSSTDKRVMVVFGPSVQ